MPIVVGFLPTPEGKAALERAIEEAELRGEKLIVVASNKGGEDFEKVGLKFDEEIEKVGTTLKDRGVDHEVHGYVRGNNPAEDVLTAARDFDAKLIVIGMRKRTPVGKMILGSNSQTIILDAPCDVLSVKAASRR